MLIIDEPNPSKFIERVNISVSDLSAAILNAWDEEYIALLELLRRTAESVARQQKRKRLIGRAAMDAIIDQAGGLKKFAKMLKKARAESPRTHETVIVAIDGFLSDTNKSWKVLINNEIAYLPKQVAEPIDNSSIKVAAWYAVNNQLPISGEFQTQSDGDIPLNFGADLLEVLRREFKRYKQGEEYNSALVITPFEKEPVIRLNLRREMHVPPEVPIILLDGSGDATLLSKLLHRQIREWKAPTQLKETRLIQVVDGNYGVSSLWNKKADQPKSSFTRLWEKIVFPLIDKHSKELVIITWKCVADHLRKRQQKGELPSELAIEHYGNTEGSNAYENRRVEILLGTPNCHPDDLCEMVNALFIAEEPIDMTRVEQWREYNYVDCDGNGYEAKVDVYADERVEMLAKIHKEYEIVQAAHRCRPMLHSGRTIYLLTRQPIDDLPPTRLTTVEQLAKELSRKSHVSTEKKGLTFSKAVQVAETLMEEEGVVWGKRFKAALEQTFFNFTKEIIYDDGVERQDLYGFPSDETLRRWLKSIAKQEEWNRSQVTIERNDRGGGASWIVVYHMTDLDEAFIRANYAVSWDIAPEDTVTVEPFPIAPNRPPEDEDWEGVQQEIEWCVQRE